MKSIADQHQIRPRAKKAPASSISQAPATVAAIDAELARLDAARRDAEAEGLRLETLRPEVLLTGSNADLDTHDEAAARCRRDVERAAARIVALRGKRDEMVAAEEDVRRRGLYNSAKAEADAVALALAKTYPKLAAGMVAMLKDLATAQAAVALVNAQLPNGAEPIPDPEIAARTVPGLPREIISEEDVELWSRLDQNIPLDVQHNVYDCGNGWGKRPGDAQPALRLRRFRKLVMREPVNPDHPIPLAAALQLPAVRGSGMLWGDAFPVFNPGLAAVLTGQAEPGAVLARIAAADAAATVRPAKAERPLQVEWVSHVDVVPLPDQPVSYDRSSRGQPSGTGSRFGASPFAAPGSRGRTGSRR